MKLDDNYVPFGDEWKKEMMKMNKSDIVDFAQKKSLELQEAQKTFTKGLTQNDYKKLFLDVLKDFHDQGYMEFTVQENFIPPEAVPEEHRENFKKNIEVAIDQKLYGYTLTLSHAGQVIYFRFAVFNIKEEFMNKEIAKGAHPISLLPDEWVRKLWHHFFIDVMCSGMIRNKEAYYEELARGGKDKSADRTGDVDIYPEKKQGVVRSLYDPKRDIN